MNIPHIALEWLIIALFILNLFLIIAVKGNDKFYIPTLLLWVILMFGLVFIKVFNDNRVEIEQSKMDRITQKNEVDMQSYKEMEKIKQQQDYENSTAFTLLGVQTIITFLLQLIGYASTYEKYYRSSAAIFFVFTVVYLVLQFKDLL
ncbi:MAG: hypothetical protein ACM3VS_15110 [Candidatus Dadabacteria bacterium]